MSGSGRENRNMGGFEQPLRDATGNQTEMNRKGLEVLVVAKGAPLWVTEVSRFVT